MATKGGNSNAYSHSHSHSHKKSSTPPAATTTAVVSKGPSLDLSRIQYRTVAPTDIVQCLEIERASYPPDEAASKNSLQYRQHHAAPYFRCAVLMPPTDEDDEGGGGGGGGGAGDVVPPETDEEDLIVGFICSTRCHDFTHDTLFTHVSNGPLLAIHSVVIRPEYRRQGLATNMLKQYIDYVQQLQQSPTDDDAPPITKLVLMSKSHLLSFYVDCGFQVTRPSPIRHGREQWYELELELELKLKRTHAVSVPPNPSVPSPQIYAETEATTATTTFMTPSDLPMGGKLCYIVDSFADANSPGTGNPAAVVLLAPHDFERLQSFSSSSTSSSSSAPTSANSTGNSNTGVLPSEPTSVMVKWMQLVAKEFNLSETAFCWPRTAVIEPSYPLLSQTTTSPSSSLMTTFTTATATPPLPTTTTTTTTDTIQYQNDTNNNDYNNNNNNNNNNRQSQTNVESNRELNWNIRYFTPKMEVALCGHATLASAAILYQTIQPPMDTKIVFHAKHDMLTMELAKEHSHQTTITTITTTASSLSGAAASLSGAAAAALTNTTESQQAKTKSINDASSLSEEDGEKQKNTDESADAIVDTKTHTATTNHPNVAGSSTSPTTAAATAFTTTATQNNKEERTTVSKALAICTKKISMEFPTKPAQELRTRDDQSAVRKMLEAAFKDCRLDTLFIGISDLGDVLVELTPASFMEIGYEHNSLDYKALLEWDGYYRGVIVCCLNPSLAPSPKPHFFQRRQVSEAGTRNKKASKSSSSSPTPSVSSNDGETITQDTTSDQPTLASSSAEEEPTTGIMAPMKTVTSEQQRDFSNPQVDFFSRFFGPKAGINEDPVTGSAHCVLGPYFSQKLKKQLVVGKQMSTRGGIVECWVSDETVLLTGTAVITMSGSLWL